jgi:predicted dehydrogenase
MKNHIGLIGCGIWGKKILHELVQLNVEVWVFEPDPINAKGASHLGATKIVYHLADLQTSNGLIVASPSSTHRAILEQVIHFSIPLFVEKPLTHSFTDALVLQQLKPINAFMMHVWRYHSGIELLGKIAREGNIGKILMLKSIRANWTSPRTDVDSVWNLAPHDLTIALEILGYIPTPKAAIAEVHQGVCRGLTAILGDVPAVVFEISNRYHDKRREVRLHGTEGVAILKDENVDYIEIHRGDALSKPDQITTEIIKFDNTSPLKRELSAFIDFLNGGICPKSSFAEGIQTIEVLHQIRELAGINS